MESGSNTLPAAALYPAIALCALAMAYAFTQTRHASGRFLILIVWLRYVMQVFHDVTHPPLYAGFSLNALVSLAVCALGAVVVRNRLRVVGRFPIVLLLLTAIVASGLINGLYAGAIETLLKWGYFFIVALCVYDCVKRDGDARIFGPLLWVFAPPLLLQAVSVALGVGKSSENDGSVSFVGGFSHEAALSIVLVTCFAVASFAPRLSPGLRIGLLTTAVIGIFAANYRTALVALAPLAIGYVAFSSARAFTSRQRLLVSAAAMVGAVGITIIAAWLLRERMADIAAAANGDVLFKAPGEFNQTERALFSGRIYLWSSYLSAYAAGDDLRLLFGFGPDAWVGVFPTYAHNTVVSYLYEFGLFGAALIVLVWMSMLMRARAIADRSLRWQMLFAHTGFIILNLATMPFWQIEGVILYGILCGYTVALTSRTAPARARMRSLVLRLPQAQRIHPRGQV